MIDKGLKAICKEIKVTPHPRLDKDK